MIFAREANRPDPKLAIPIAGDDPEAVQVAAGLVRDAGFDPVVVGKLVDASRFQRGAPGYGQAVSAAELKQKLSLAAVTSLQRWLGWAVPATPQERAAALWSFAYFFTLLAGYYVLRPLRDQMGIAGGVKNLPWLFTATFVTLLVAQPLYGALVAKLPRARFIPIVYHFFVANLALFWLLLTLDVAPVIVARVFFVWVSVFNLFAVAVFWSFMADLFTAEQGKRLFGFIGAGGTAGALLGPGHHHRAVGAARPGQPADRRGRCFWNWRCSASTGSSARPMRGRRAAPGAEQRVGGSAFAALPELIRSPYLLGVGAWVSLLSFGATIALFRAGQHRVRHGPWRRRADAHLRQHRSGGRTCSPWRRRSSPPASCSSGSAPASRPARCRRSTSWASPRWRWRRRSPSWWSSRWRSAG